MRKLLISLMALTVALVLAACGGDDGSDDKDKDKDKGGGENGQASQQQKMPEPDLKDVPDVVAKVNGDKIKKKEFSSMYQSVFQRSAMQSRLTGKEVDQKKLKKQTAEVLVGNELLKQEANNRDYSASDKAVDKKLNDLAKQNGLESKDKLLSKLKEQGTKKNEVISQIKTQVKMDKLVAEESGDIEPTEKELKKAYDQWKSQKKQAQKNKKDNEDGDSGKDSKKDKEIASFDEKKSDLKQSIKSKKEAQARQTLVDKLRKDADVTINL
ncbi:SurA N-terminal domain-containing protein [Lentibacillus halophilus]|uniref:peptidylprolyl isomerase n=1 Tax=Lentibacillus halophilus TaxID=295065 RepID=A0ABN0Z3G2_9BACI